MKFHDLTLRKKLVFLLTAAVFLSALMTWFFLYRSERAELIKENSSALSRYLDLFEESGKDGGLAGIKEFYVMWEKIYPDGRLTVVNEEGDVLMDSSANPEMMDNHYRRGEITDALAKGEGSEQRYSKTLNMWHNYVAKKINIPSPSGEQTREDVIVRLSYPVDRLGSLAKSMGLSFLLSIAAAVLLIWGMSYLMLSTIMNPLTKLTRAAEALSEGHPARFPTAKSEEVRKLSLVLNTVYDSLQENLKKEEERKNELASLIEVLPIGVILTDDNRKVRYINRTAKELCSFESDSSPVGTSVEVVLPSVEMCAMIYAEDATSLITIPRSGGIFLEVSTFTLTRGKIIIIRDLTEKVKLDEARRDFFIDAGHEFQTPLTVIRTGLDLLKSSEAFADEEDAEMIDRMIGQQERITGLVDDLLLLVKLDSDPLKAEREEIDLRALFAELMAEIKELPASAGVDLKLSLPEAGKLSICGRRADVKRALFNLMENAVKYVSSYRSQNDGVVELTLADSGNSWVVSVDDNGPGVTDSERDIIFDRFRRGEEHRMRRKGSVGGYGLGLSISRRIAERHGGKLKLTTRPRLGGASFEMTLSKE